MSNLRSIEILECLIALQSISADSNIPVIDYIEGLLKDSGFSTTRLFSPDSQKAGLYAQTGPAGAGILLSGHSDVVPVTGQKWTSDPFQLTEKDNKLYGRGSADMKGFIASALAMTEKAARVDLKEPLKIVISYDEEVGCLGMKAMMSELLPLVGQPRACIVGEPTEMAVAIGHKGKVAYQADCYGQAGHSAFAPDYVNALHVATDLVGSLRDWQTEMMQSGGRDEDYDIPYSTVHVGTLAGGTALNIVPDKAELCFECRYPALDSMEGIQGRIAAIAENIAASYVLPGRQKAIVLTQNIAYPGLDVSPADPVVGFVQKLTGLNTITKVAFGTEAGFFAGAGIPTVVCGPGSMEQGHKADEYLAKDQLAACDQMMDRLLQELSL